MTDTPLRVHRRQSGYVHVWNDIADDDQQLSYLALGLLTYMLSRPPGWAFHRDRLCRGPEGDQVQVTAGLRRRRAAREGREAVARGLRELAAAGYYRTRKYQGELGRFGTVTEVTDTPGVWPSEVDQ